MIMMTMTFAFVKLLYIGDKGIDQSTGYHPQGRIKEAKENDVPDIPLPFKRKGQHYIPPLLSLV
jgi:hypothetical protein